ncbi:MAG TPA: hypothetical protein VE127_03210 [Solirubrobacteraceae bacterium]|nr:hypothetical protein [Solirubrobacteraceae bacterium]
MKPIEGTLTKPGYTLIALADNGRASSVTVKGRRFKLRPPASEVTLQLRAPDGTYAGPVVAQAKEKTEKKSATKAKKKGKKKRVIVGFKAGAKLGKIKLHPGKGYAKVEKRLGEKWIDAKRWAQASSKGVPIGNGANVGLVRSTAHASAADPADPDRDGVPNSLDVDDNGNLILDQLESGASASASQVAHSSAGAPPNLFTFSNGGGNLNVYGSTDAEMVAALRMHLWIQIGGVGLDSTPAPELDCGLLSWCSANGTGRLHGPMTDFAHAEGFPDPCCDENHNGLAEMAIGQFVGHDSFYRAIYPGAGPDQIRPGDVLIVRGKRGGAPFELTRTLGLVLSGPAAVGRYDDGQGNSGTLSYPFYETSPPPRPGFPVRANASGDVVVNLTFWRPQRLRIATEPGSGSWMDVGHQDYVAQAREAGPVPFPPGVYSPVPNGGCPASSYSNVDPKLSPQPAGASPLLMPFPSFLDLADDQPTNREAPFDNTFSYTLNLTDCLASYGIPFDVGQSRRFDFWTVHAEPANGALDTRTSEVNFERVP